MNVCNIENDESRKRQKRMLDDYYHTYLPKFKNIKFWFYLIFFRRDGDGFSLDRLTADVRGEIFTVGFWCYVDLIHRRRDPYYLFIILQISMTSRECTSDSDQSHWISCVVCWEVIFALTL